MPVPTPVSVTAEQTAAETPVVVGLFDVASRRRVALRRVVRQPALVVGLVVTAAVLAFGLLAPVLAPGDPFAPAGAPLQPPSAGHPFGTDNLSRDIADAVVHGLRTSTVVAGWVVAMSAVIGVGVGALAGYRGGAVDDVLMRVTELVQSVPKFFLVILAVALYGSGTANLVFVLGLTSWPVLARVVRSRALSLREREFVEAARSLGAKDRRILARHVVPNVAPEAVVLLALLASQVVLLEASVSFLGLGDPNVMSLGFLVANAQRFLRAAWWMSVFPGATIAVAVVGVNLLADGLNDVLAGGR